MRKQNTNLAKCRLLWGWPNKAQRQSESKNINNRKKQKKAEKKVVLAWPKRESSSAT